MDLAQKQQLAMTTKIPKVRQGHYAFSKVTEVRKDLGVFLDIGLPDKEVVLSLDELPTLTNLWPKVEDELLIGLRIDEKDRIKQQTSDLAKFIQNEYQRNVHKLNKLQQTLFESQNSDDLRIKGDLLFANLHLLKKGQKEITVENYYDGTMMTIPLDERYDGKTNANKYYAKYQKAKKALSHLQEQIQITENEIHYFDTLITMMDNASYYDALEIKEELENLGYLKKKKTKQVHRPQKLHIETYITKDQIPIYVGKNNLQNDYLTFKMAAKNDMWFHVKDMPGSHVVVHSQNLDEYTIRLASQLAAYFSKGKHSSSVPVNYTLVKTLKKPQGGKPGQVILSHYSTIYIDPDESLFNDIHKVNS